MGTGRGRERTADDDERIVLATFGRQRRDAREREQQREVDRCERGGQHDHQRLFETSEQLRLIDTFGRLDGALDGYHEHRQRWLSLVEQVDEYETGEAERLQRLDFLRFQAGEFADVDPSLDDHEALLEERATLRHGVELREQLGGNRLRFTDRQRRRLAVKAKAIGRRRLIEVGT